MKKYLQHPLSAAFPAMEAKDLEALKADIQDRGQMQPVIIYDGMILDGWHRYTCCSDLGIKVLTEPLGKGLDPVAYVQSVNLHRRHLTGSQRAAAVVACASWMPSHRPNKGEPGSPLTVSDMAKAAEVSERTIQQAKKAQDAGLSDAVRDGKVTAKEAAEIAKLPEPERKAAVEAPAPKVAAPKPAPKATDDRDARIVQLNELLAQRDNEIAEMRERAGEVADLLAEATRDNNALAAENESLKAVINTESGGRLMAMMAENKRLSEEAATIKANAERDIRVYKSQANGFMVGNNDLGSRLKSALKKIDKLEKKIKGTVGQGAGSEPEDVEVRTSDDEYNAAFSEVG
jgi:regulator of replication initiation timing